MRCKFSVLIAIVIIACNGGEAFAPSAVNAANELFFNHPSVSTSTGVAILRSGSIEKIDLETGQHSVVVSGLDYPSGIAFDASGNLYFGNVTYGPVQVELMKLDPDGNLTSLGTVVDTSAGLVSIGGWGFDVALFPTCSGSDHTAKQPRPICLGVSGGNITRYSFQVLRGNSGGAGYGREQLLYSQQQPRPGQEQFRHHSG